MPDDDFDDEEPKTPPDSPSGAQKLGLEHCLECDGEGSHAGVVCPQCKGGRRMTHEQAKLWRERHKRQS